MAKNYIKVENLAGIISTITSLATTIRAWVLPDKAGTFAFLDDITTAVNAAVAGLYDDRGNFNASVNAYPSSGGSGSAGAILKGDVWTVSVAGTLPTAKAVSAGDTVRALVDTPGNTEANWAIVSASGLATPDATSSTKGKMKLFTSTGSDTDGTMDRNSITTALGAKQATLVSSTNIKTINGSSLLGSGDLSVGGGSADLADFASLTDAAPVVFNATSLKEPKGYLETSSSRTLDITNVRGYNDALKYSVITLIVKKTTASDILITLDSDFTNKDIVSDGAVSGYTLAGAINSYFKLYGVVFGQVGGAIVWWNLVSSAATGIGVQDLPISSAAMWPKTTNGCADLAKTQIATSEVNIQSLDFDQTTQEFASFQIVLPRNWNNGTVFAKFYWTATGSPTGDVEWGIAAGAYSDGDALTAALGTAQVITDTFLANDQIHITSATPAITVAGSPQDGDFVFFRVSRNPANAGDTLTADAKLLFVVLIITTDSSTAQ